jgi:ATP-binding cassette, subfamily B, multidrug efflux pump
MFMGKKSRAKNVKGTVARLWGYLKRDFRLLTFVSLLVLAGSAMQVAGPVLTGKAIDAMAVPLLDGNAATRVDFDALRVQVLLLGASYLAGSLAAWGQMWLMVRVAQNTVRSLRRDLFGRLQMLSLRYFDGKPHGELMSRLTNDVENLNNVLTQNATQLISSGALLLGTFAIMLYYSPILTVFTVVTVPIGILLTNRISKHTRKYFTAQQKELGELNGYVEESLSGLKVIKAYGMEGETQAHFGEVNRRLNQAGIRAQIFSGVIPPIMNAVNNLSFAIVAVAGGALVIRGLATVGLVAMFTGFSRQFSRPISELANLYNLIQSAIAGAERVFEVMDEPPEFGENAAQGADDKTLAQAGTATEAHAQTGIGTAGLLQPGLVPTCLRGEVEFRDVSFAYVPGVPVLRHISLKVEPGHTIALVGPTGSGKTTVVNLLTRFYDIDEGCILVDGMDLRTLQKDFLRAAMGIVLQDSHLFTDTVRENIRYGRLNATDAEVEEAASVAEADGFIRRLPDGYDTILTEDAGNISQGQRQLLTIARAILADPPILILDEATSNVDTLTEMHIQRAMRKLMSGRTSFVIAHRLSTIRDADEILYLRDGEIRERGKHEELIAQKGFYNSLHAQLAKH